MRAAVIIKQPVYVRYSNVGIGLMAIHEYCTAIVPNSEKSFVLLFS